MNVGGLLTGLVLLLAGLNWASVVAVDWKLIGILAIIAGIIWIINSVGVVTTIPLHRNNQA